VKEKIFPCYTYHAKGIPIPAWKSTPLLISTAYERWRVAEDNHYFLLMPDGIELFLFVLGELNRIPKVEHFPAGLCSTFYQVKR